jgi:tetratricopeptide (TPR) repeat protein
MLVRPMTSSQENRESDSLPADSLVITYPDDSSNPKDMALWAGVLVLLALVAYWPATDGKFVWNDDANVSRNVLLLEQGRQGGLGRIWTQRWSEPKAYPMAQYHPLTDTVYWLQFQLFGRDADGTPDPFGFHVTNLVLAAGAVVLVWLILHKLKLPGAWVAAAVFAVHPLNTETVAWISQLASVLAAVLFFASIYAFLVFTEEHEKSAWREAVDPARQWGFYAASFVLFVLAMLSKSTAFAMPMVMLLILWWQRRLSARYVALLLPMLIIGVVMAFWAADFERLNAGMSEINLNVGQRWVLAGRVVWFYVGKVLWPTDLTFLYPKWSLDGGSALQYLPVVAAAIVILALGLLHRKLGRGPVVAAGAFVVCLMPALGFFDQAPMRFTFVADHYAYLATLPLIALVVSAGARALGRARLANSHGRSAIGLSLILVVVLGSMSWVRAHVFGDNVSLWQDTVAKNPGSWFAHVRYASALGVQADQAREGGDADEVAKDLNLALEQALQAEAINPLDAETQSILGRIYWQQKKADQGIEHLARATELDPSMHEPWQDLATALIAQNRFSEAIIRLDEAIRLEPRSSALHRLLGEAYAGLGQDQRAISEQRFALEYKPDNTIARQDYADLLAKNGKIKEAMYQYTLDLQTKSDQPRVWYKVGILSTQENDLENAAKFFQTALKLDPGFTEAKDKLELAEKILKERAATRPATGK